MAATLHHVFMIFVFTTLCAGVITLPNNQNDKQTSGENLGVSRAKRSAVISNFCADKSKIWYHHKCRSLEEIRRLKDNTEDYEDFTSTDILYFTDTGEAVEDEVTYIKSNAVSEPATSKTTHQEATNVPPSTVTKEVQTVHQDATESLSESTTRIPDKTYKYRKLNRTRNYYDFLTTKILVVIDTGHVVGDKVTSTKTSTASEPTTLETRHQEPTKVTPSTVTKEVETVSTSTNTTRILDEVHELEMKISTIVYIIIGCAVFFVLCSIFLLYWYFCLRRNTSTSYLQQNTEVTTIDNYNDGAAEPLKLTV